MEKFSDRLKEAIRYGKKLYEKNIIDGAGGNMSFRAGNHIYITRSGLNLEELDENSFVDITPEIQSTRDIEILMGKLKQMKASSDSLIHLMVYQKTGFNAVIHCHGVYNVVLSLNRDKIIPSDLEGNLFLREISVIDGEFMSADIAKKISDEISDKGFAIVRGHGIYAAGDTFRDAFNLVCYIEHSCQVLFLQELYRRIQL